MRGPHRYRFRARVVFVASLLAAGGCGEPTRSGESIDAAPEPLAAERRCPPLEAPFSMPEDIEGVRRWVNALPKPTTLACFIESLPRPLQVQAAVSELSAQLSVGERSPRFFLFSESLVLTLAPEGIGASLLEMSVLESASRSLKAEIEFPVETELSASAPYEKALLVDGQTGCALCHPAEVPDPSIEFAEAFVSDALRPHPSRRVALAALAVEAADCDAELEPERCQFLKALFAHGPVEEHDFPEAMPICFPEDL